MSNTTRSGRARRSDLAHRQLRRMLLRGQVGDNGHLVEADLGRMLGMGRTPIREALLRLEADGLVESTPNAGFRVRHLSQGDLCDLHEIRFALESLAIRMACRQPVSGRTLAMMMKLCDSMAELGRGGRWRDADDKDLQFHRRLMTLARSPQLEMTVRVSHLVVFTWNRAQSEQQRVEDAERSCREHRIIIEHIQRGEADQAVQALSDHLRNARADVMTRKGRDPDHLVSPDSVGSLARDGWGKSALPIADSNAAPPA